MADGRGHAAPPIPGYLRFAWMLFMQPIQLNARFRLTGPDWRMPLGHAILRAWRGDTQVRELLFRSGSLVGAAPFAVVGLAILLKGAGIEIVWIRLLMGCAWGVIFAVALAFVTEVVPSVAAGVVFGASSGILTSIPWELPAAFTWAIVAGIILGSFASQSAQGLKGRLRLISIFAPIFGALFGLSSGFGLFGQKGLSVGITLGVLVAIIFAVVATHAFLLPLHLLTMMIITASASQSRVVQLARFLPYRHFDLIFFPLPGVRSFLVLASERSAREGMHLILEAAQTLAQWKAAFAALLDLQARSLERAAVDKSFDLVAERALPFLGGSAEGNANDRVESFVSAAKDLRAARTSRIHSHRREALARAEAALRNRVNWITSEEGPSIGRRFLPVLARWLEVVAAEREALARDEADRPQVPVPFVVGPALQPENERVFRGRDDLAKVINHDLAGDCRAPILLSGQRRMGKSSLLNMLPILLGSGTRVVQLNFQALSGSPHRARPHRWLAEEVAKAWPDAGPTPEDAAWLPTLEWLRRVDGSLATAGRRLLVAVDEVERLQDEIEKGNADTDFLDLVRASGDALVRVRFLLATAYSLPRLGRQWVDRLINVLPRRVQALPEPVAQELIEKPIPEFPAIYPLGGVDRIVAATGGHPYLIQYVCDALCRRINEAGRLTATRDDLEAALDQAVTEPPLYDELWRQRSEDERAILRAIAAGRETAGLPEDAVRDLLREDYLVRRDDSLAFATPLFADWIEQQFSR